MVNFKKINKAYLSFNEKSVFNRYLTIDHLSNVLMNYRNSEYVEFVEIGKSYLNNSINRIKIGNGTIKILIWSQMHGNESTGTKAIFDLLRFLTKTHSFHDIKEQILENLCIYIIPILNPDGAEAYTRLNAQEIDLNRDVINQKAPESRLLINQLKEINPKWCFNLHDQRSIFSVGVDNLPATLSFLAPSTNKSRTVTNGRKETMQLIATIFKGMQSILPNQIGRYTDEFYPTATGDNFQKMGYNTILIEAGHNKKDYTRESTRKFNFLAMLIGLNAIVGNTDFVDYKMYFKIPNNKKNFADYLFTNLKVGGVKKSVQVVFKESLKVDKILFVPEIIIQDFSKKYNASVLKNNKMNFISECELMNYVKKHIKSFEV